MRTCLQSAAKAGPLVFLAVALGTATACRAAVTISTDTTSNMNCSGGVCEPTETDAVLNVNDLENLLASGSVTVTTTGAGNVQANDIAVMAGLAWSSTAVLSLDAYQSIAVENPISIKAVSGLVLSNNDGGSGGTLSFGSKGRVKFAQLSSILTINGTGYTLVKKISTLASAIAANPSGAFAFAGSYDAAGHTYRAAPIGTTFAGKFNGLGNAITHLTIHAAAKNTNVGLFADVDAGGSISSVRLASADIHGKGSPNMGSLVGLTYGTLFNVLASGSVSASAGDGVAIGGLFGANVGAVQNAVSTATVSVNSKVNIATAAAGGLGGENDGTIEQSYATGPVSIAGTATGSVAGGLVGFNNGPLMNCYGEGAVSVPGMSDAGGLVGADNSPISNAYSTGSVQAGSGSFIGGFVGYDQSNGGLSDDYWDTSTSGITNLSQGAGNIANDPGITGETTEQLQAGLPAGFDPAIWAESANINGGLPYLVANPPSS